ncbi:MAG: hypothetical protein R6X07_03205 [Desulfatiglandales bacterium]
MESFVTGLALAMVKVCTRGGSKSPIQVFNFEVKKDVLFDMSIHVCSN